MEILRFAQDDKRYPIILSNFIKILVTFYISQNDLYIVDMFSDNSFDQRASHFPRGQNVP